MANIWKMKFLRNIKISFFFFLMGLCFKEFFIFVFGGKYMINPISYTSVNNKTQWCVLDPTFMSKNMRKHFYHFPHALEAILPCYSKLIEKNAITTKLLDEEIGETLYERNCGFMVHINLAKNETSLSPYIKQVLDKIGCKVKFWNRYDQVPKGNFSFRNNFYRLQSRMHQIKYIDRPEHAHFLRRQFIPDKHIGKIKGEKKTLQIGLINRKTSRRVLNMQTDLLKEVKKVFPNANITYSEFEFYSVQEQVEWFATKDVIIAPHGAAITNSLWITSNTIVMQMYPDGYFLPTLEPLIEQAGGIALQWYNKSIDPVQEHKKWAKEKLSWKPQWQISIGKNFTVQHEEVVKKVKFALSDVVYFKKENELLKLI